nr:immunoglobulin light chain junction region [Macaca mulatta]MPN89492.1 immunoglobulin light chain junction region [Macaca mulatta]
CRQGIQFPFTF